MSATSSLELVARDMFEQQSNLEARLARRGIASDDTHQLCPVSWLLPDLLHLLAENHGSDAHDLRPAIRRIILDRGAIYAMGAGITQSEADEILEGQIDLIVRVLEQVRQQALDCGEWSESTAPAWFG